MTEWAANALAAAAAKMKPSFMETSGLEIEDCQYYAPECVLHQCVTHSAVRRSGARIRRRCQDDHTRFRAALKIGAVSCNAISYFKQKFRRKL
jgi:hypothetical protein